MNKIIKDTMPSGVVLIAEDRVPTNETLTNACQKRGYTVVSFTQLKEAKMYYEKYKEQILLYVIDGTLQYNYDGFDWAQELYEQNRRVILCSAQNYRGEMPYLRKPFGTEKFLSLLDSTMSQI